MSPIYQLKCKACGQEFEAICSVDTRDWQACDACGSTAKVIPAIRGPNCANEGAGWIATIREVVDKDSNFAVDKAMLKPHPTRSDYKAWMRFHGIRPLETGEKPYHETIDIERHTDKMMQMRQERNRIHVR